VYHYIPLEINTINVNYFYFKGDRKINTTKNVEIQFAIDPFAAP